MFMPILPLHEHNERSLIMIPERESIAGLAGILVFHGLLSENGRQQVVVFADMRSSFVTQFMVSAGIWLGIFILTVAVRLDIMHQSPSSAKTTV